MSLTERQRGELNAAILDYLMQYAPQFSNTISEFQKEAKLDSEADITKGVLEKKWSAILRLQKRVQDLEAHIVDMQEKNRLSNTISTNGLPAVPAGEVIKGLPRAPARFKLEGHRGAITSVAIHPIYSVCASGSEDNTIRLWDFEVGQYERTLKGHLGAITGIEFNHDGSLLASSSLDMTVKLWDTKDNSYNCIKTLKGHEHTISAVKFSSNPNDTILFTCSRDQSIKLWDITTGYCLRTLLGHSEWVKSISVISHGSGLLLASAGADQTIVIWNLLDVSNSSSSSGGGSSSTVGSNGSSSGSGAILHTLKGHEHVIETVCFRKKASISAITSSLQAAATAASASPPSSLSSGETSLPGMNDDSNAIYLLSGSRDRSIKLWDALKGLCLMTFTSHENWVRCVLGHANPRYILSASDDRSIRITDIKENRCLRTISDAHDHFITCLATSTKYPVLISGSVDKKVIVWQCS